MATPPPSLTRATSGEFRSFEEGIGRVLTLLHADNTKLQSRLAAVEAGLAELVNKPATDGATQTSLDARAMIGPMAVLDRLTSLEHVVLGADGSGTASGFVGAEFALHRCAGSRGAGSEPSMSAAGSTVEQKAWAAAERVPPDVLQLLERGHDLEVCKRPRAPTGLLADTADTARDPHESLAPRQR